MRPEPWEGDQSSRCTPRVATRHALPPNASVPASPGLHNGSLREQLAGPSVRLPRLPGLPDWLMGETGAGGELTTGGRAAAGPAPLPAAAPVDGGLAAAPNRGLLKTLPAGVPCSLSLAAAAAGVLPGLPAPMEAGLPNGLVLLAPSPANAGQCQPVEASAQGCLSAVLAAKLAVAGLSPMPTAPLALLTAGRENWLVAASGGLLLHVGCHVGATGANALPLRPACIGQAAQAVALCEDGWAWVVDLPACQLGQPAQAIPDFVASWVHHGCWACWQPTVVNEAPHGLRPPLHLRVVHGMQASPAVARSTEG